MFLSMNWIGDFVDLSGFDKVQLIKNFTLSTAEVEDIIKEQGMLEIKCDYCRKNYVYTEKDLDYLFEEDK